MALALVLVAIGVAVVALLIAVRRDGLQIVDVEAHQTDETRRT